MLHEHPVQHSALPDLSLFPGLHSCFWRIVGAHLTTLARVIGSLVHLENLCRLHLSAAFNITPLCLRPLTHRLKRLALDGGAGCSTDFVQLVSLSWPVLETLVVGMTHCSPDKSGDLVVENPAMTLPSLTNLFLARFPPELDFLSFFRKLPSLLKLTILDTPNTPLRIHENLLPRLMWLRAPISLVRALVPLSPIEYLHLVGSQGVNDQQFFHFLHGKSLATLVCEYGFSTAQVQNLLSDTFLGIDCTVLLKKLVVHPVCVPLYG